MRRSGRCSFVTIAKKYQWEPVQYQKHCPGCFARKNGVPVCEVCGYDESVPRSPIFLPHGTLLASQYRVGRVLGKPGGFGITYLGWDVNLQQRVAIKEFMPPEIAARVPESLNITVHTQDHRRGFDTGKDYFLREARTVAQLDHPNIVRVRNFFNANDTAYLVMDYYEGMTLDDYLTSVRPTFDASLAISVIRPILDGLRAVHERGVVHRDIKPHNIYLATIGKPILLDFGAARQAIGNQGQSMSVVLTEGYAPLEQYQRRTTQGPWTDVYACAATLYRMIVGEGPPFALDRLQKDPLAEDNYKGIPEGLKPAITKALALRPEERYQTAQEFMDALDAFKASLKGPTPEPIRPPDPVLTKTADVPRPPRKDVPPPAPVAAAPAPKWTPPPPPPVAAAPAPSAGASVPLMKYLPWALLVLVAGAIWFLFFYQPQAYQPSTPQSKPKPAATATALADLPDEIVRPQQPLTPLERKSLPGVVSLGGALITLRDKADTASVKLLPFKITESEITVEQFRLFVDKTGYSNPQWASYPCTSGGTTATRSGWDGPGYNQTEQHPVTCVSYRDARAYAAWLSQATDRFWRLPTEAEWEYANRAGTRSTYWWGNEFKPGIAACTDCPPQIPGKPALAVTGTPNAFGLLHTADNVSEWTCSVFAELAIGEAGKCGTMGESSRVSVRGGSWKSSLQTLQSDHRAYLEPDKRNAWTGFRLVQE